MKFSTKKIIGYSFTGDIADQDLPKKYQELLNVDPNSDFCYDIIIEGDYTIEWDDDIPMPRVTNLFLDNGNKYIEVNLDDFGNEIYDLEEQILQSGYDWEADRLAETTDRAVDDWKDREMFGDE